ncbi:unnamed protein product, partial [Cuscuta campestris]
SVSSVVVGTHVWVEDPVVAWIDGEVVEINGGDITVNCTSGAIIKYKSFDKVEERKWWHIPIITELLEKNGLESALKIVLGREMVQARQFVHFAFPWLKWTDQSNDTGIWKDQASNETEAIGKHSDHSGDFDGPSGLDRSINYSNQSDSYPDPECSTNCSNLDEHKSSDIEVVEASLSDKHFWKNIADIVNHNVVQRIGFPAFDKIRQPYPKKGLEKAASIRPLMHCCIAAFTTESPRTSQKKKSGNLLISRSSI